MLLRAIALLLVLTTVVRAGYVEDKLLPAYEKYRKELKNLRPLVTEAANERIIETIEPCSDGFGTYEISDPTQGTYELKLPCNESPSEE